jgi:Cu/Ag efflux protein CusF
MTAGIGAAGRQFPPPHLLPASRRLSDPDPSRRRRMRIAAILAGVLAAAAPSLCAQQPAAVSDRAATALGKVVDARTMQIVATVEAVDAANRSVTLKGPRGQIETMTVSEEVRNLRQVKAGDRVAVTYAQGLALQLKKGGPAIRERVEREGGTRAAPGARPGGVVGREVKVVADVVVVNTPKQTVTLRGPGQTVTLKVRDAALLKSITTGDWVEAVYTEAVAVVVKPVPKTSE